MRTGRLAPIRLLLMAAAVLCAAGCQGSVESQGEERGEIEALLRAYLPKLGEAYATLDAEVLRPHAVNREIATVQARIDDLTRQGRQLRAELKSVTVEELEILRSLNAHVTTHEVWNLRVFALGTDSQLREELGQVNRVSYQLAKREGRWQVLYREIRRQ